MSNPYDMMDRNIALHLASESGKFGKLNVEREITLYAKMTNLAELQGLPMETHEQWKLDMGNDKLRSRLRLIDGKTYTMCTKRKNSAGDAMLEAESEISEALYNELLNIAHHGYAKTRYTYHIPDTDLCYEIDVFFNAMGVPHPWVKIDLEYPADLPKLPVFPFQVDQDCTIVGDDMDDDEAKFVDSLWEEEWSRLDSTRSSLDPFYNRDKYLDQKK